MTTSPSNMAIQDDRRLGPSQSLGATRLNALDSADAAVAADLLAKVEVVLHRPTDGRESPSVVHRRPQGVSIPGDAAFEIAKYTGTGTTAWASRDQ
jgi:hypothetical protein